MQYFWIVDLSCFWNTGLFTYQITLIKKTVWKIRIWMSNIRIPNVKLFFLANCTTYVLFFWKGTIALLLTIEEIATTQNDPKILIPDHFGIQISTFQLITDTLVRPKISIEPQSLLHLTQSDVLHAKTRKQKQIVLSEITNTVRIRKPDIWLCN